jgi:hypothetical protein
MTRMIRCGFRFVIILIAVASASCWQGETRSVLASILAVHGEVVLAENSARSVHVDLSSKPGANCVLKTSAGADIDLMLVPGALVHLSSNSELKIHELKLTKDGNETDNGITDRVARIELERGKMIVLFEGTTRFTITTRHAAITVTPSCLFQIETDETKTRLTCVRGKVFSSPSQSEISLVDAGYFRVWPSREPPAISAEDSRAQIDTAEALKVGSRLRELESARQNRLPR